MRRFLLTLLAALCLAAPTVLQATAEPHRLALQVTDNDADKMNAALNVAQNVSVYYSSKGQEIEIQIVAFNAGLHMLRDDTSPVNMSKREGKTPPLVGNADLVPSGAVTLIELSEKGWTILRP